MKQVGAFFLLISALIHVSTCWTDETPSYFNAHLRQRVSQRTVCTDNDDCKIYLNGVRLILNLRRRNFEEVSTNCVCLTQDNACEIGINHISDGKQQLYQELVGHESAKYRFQDVIGRGNGQEQGPGVVHSIGDEQITREYEGRGHRDHSDDERYGRDHESYSDDEGHRH